MPALPAALAAALLLPGTAAAAQCAPRAVVLDRLAAAYGETRRSMGLAGQSALVEVFASDETGTWTIIVTGTNGLACMIAAGRNYQAVADTPPAPGDDA
jgi:hypothetical protein